MSDQCTPPCHWCGTAKCVRPSHANLKAWYCGKCGREFEDGPDDGVVGYGMPERFAIRNENYAKSRRARR